MNSEETIATVLHKNGVPGAEHLAALVATALAEEEDICGLCGETGADKFAHPVHWPGEAIPNGNLVHQSCEQEECRRAHSLLSDREREVFLRSV